MKTMFGREAEREAFEQLQAGKCEEVTLRLIKNLLVGSTTSKKHFVELGLIPLLKKTFTKQSSDTALIQAADCIGSLAQPFTISSNNFTIDPPLSVNFDPMDIEHSVCPVPTEEEITLQLISQGFPTLLLDLLSHSNTQVILSSIRALKNIFSASCAPRDLNDENFHKVSSLLHHSDERIVVLSAQLLACIMSSRHLPISNLVLLIPQESPAQAPTSSRIPKEILSLQSSLAPLRRLQQLLIPETLQVLLLLVQSKPRSILLQTSALEALAQLSFDNSDAATLIMQNNNQETSVARLLIDIIRNCKNPQSQLHAAHCITNFNRARALPKEIRQSIRLVVIPKLIQLIHIEGDDRESVRIKEQAPLVLARLVETESVLQKTVIETNFLANLTSLLRDVEEVKWKRVCANRLLLLASICSLHLNGRQILARSAELFVKLLSSPFSIVRAACCRVIQTLSRSLKELRTSLLDANVAKPLIQLLSDNNLDVKITASAAICNLVLAFSAMKDEIVKLKGVQQLCALLHSPCIEIRCNALWALRNMVYASEVNLKKDVLKEMGEDLWKSLFSDTYLEIQTQTLILLRNIVCKDAALVVDNAALVGYHLDIKSILLEKLATGDAEMVKQCLFIVCNICAEFNHKSLGMNPEILAYIRKNLDHVEENIRHVAVLCLINLTSVCLDNGNTERKKILKEMGFEDILVQMKTKESGRMVEQLNTCLAQFSSSSCSDADIDMNMVD